MTAVATTQASHLKQGMNKVVLDVPALLIPLAKFLGEASGIWNGKLPLIEQQAKAKGFDITMPRESFYLNAAGKVWNKAQGKPPAGYQYIQRKYYNAQLRKFVVWVKVN